MALTILKIAGGVVLGGGVGFLLHYVGKCAGGTWGINANPFIAVGFWALLGALVAAGVGK